MQPDTLFFCHEPAGAPCHPCGPACPVVDRRYHTARWGEGGIVLLCYADAQGQGKGEFLPVLGDGSIYVYASVAANVPVHVIACATAFVAQCHRLAQEHEL